MGRCLLLTTLLAREGTAGEYTTILQPAMSNVHMLSLSLTGLLLPRHDAIHVQLPVFWCPCVSIQVKSFVLVSCLAVCSLTARWLQLPSLPRLMSLALHARKTQLTFKPNGVMHREWY